MSEIHQSHYGRLSYGEVSLKHLSQTFVTAAAAASDEGQCSFIATESAALRRTHAMCWPRSPSSARFSSFINEQSPLKDAARTWEQIFNHCSRSISGANLSTKADLTSTPSYLTTSMVFQCGEIQIAPSAEVVCVYELVP